MAAVSFSRFESEILALYEPPHRKPATRDKMRKVLGEFGSLRAKKPSDRPMVRRTSEITPGAILRWLEVYGHREKTTNLSYLNTFRAAVRIGCKMQWIRVNPWSIRTHWITFDDVDLDEIEDRRPRHLSIEQLLAILDQADAEAILGSWEAGRLQALVYMYAYAGFRKMEALGLRVADIDLANDLIFLKGTRVRRLKTLASRRPMGIAPELKVVLERWIPRCGSEYVFANRRKRTRPWFSGTSGTKPLDCVKALGERAGVPDTTIQTFRRTLATHGKRMGLGPLEIKDLLRHSEERTQEWYLEDDFENFRAAARRISFRQFAPSAPLNAG